MQVLALNRCHCNWERGLFTAPPFIPRSPRPPSPSLLPHRDRILDVWQKRSSILEDTACLRAQLAVKKKKGEKRKGKKGKAWVMESAAKAPAEKFTRFLGKKRKKKPSQAVKSPGCLFIYLFLHVCISVADCNAASRVHPWGIGGCTCVCVCVYVGAPEGERGLSLSNQ